MQTYGENSIHYCPIGEPQRRFGVYVTGAGREVTRPNEPYPHAYHSSDYYFTWQNGRTLPAWEHQILYIRAGCGVIEFTRGQSISVTAGTLIFLHAGEWHRYHPDPNTGWEEAYVGIGGKLLDGLISISCLSAHPCLIALPPDGWFDQSLRSLIDEIQSSSAEHPYTLALKTLALLSQVAENAAAAGVPSNGTRHNVAIRRATLHIGRHLDGVVDFPALAQRLGMGYTLFRRCFRAYTGLAPLAYQNALRIRRSMHLLASTEIPIAQIARETGFNSPAYFSRFFRKATGISPSAFRRQRA